MEPRSLRAFVEVVRRGGFSHAAPTVCLTQSAVSKAVKRLEDELGFVLLDRAAREPRLTDAGEIVFRRGLRLLAEWEDTRAELRELRGLERGALRLGLPPIGSSTLFAPLFATFRRRHPGIEVHLVERGSDRLVEDLRAGEVDLAAILLPAPDDFDHQVVRREPLAALLPADHPLAGRETIALAELKGTPFILFEDGFALNRIILDICRRHGFTPEIAARGGQIEFLIELVAQGVGAVFLPRMIAEERSRPGTAHATVVDPGTEWHIAMMWRTGAYLSHAAAAWLEVARAGNGPSKSA